MQDHVELDDLDRLIVNAVQVNPRVSWAQVGAALEVDPVTIARRWDRLQEARVVWITPYIDPAVQANPVALVEVDCAGHFLDIAAELADDPQCATIDITSGGCALLTVTTSDQQSLTNYLLGRLGSLDWTRSVRYHLVTRLIVQGTNWRLHRLTEAQETRLARPGRAPGPAPSPTREFTRDERAILRCLRLDVRMTAAEIASRTGLSQKRAGNLLRDLLDSHRVALRVDMQRSASGWPVYAWFFLRVPSNMTDTISQQLGKLAEIRTVAQVAGPSNVILAVWLRELADVGRLEAAIEEQLPNVQISDRSVVLRTTKHAGVVLDEEGRRAR